MDIISSKKPDVPKKPEISIEYNNRSFESYINNGFADNIPHLIRGPHDRMQQFLSKVDLRKGPIERSVRSIVRLKASDWSSSTKKNERKEFVYYEEYWDAKDWLGIPIDPFDGHIEGRYTEVLMKPKLDERTGEHVDNVFAGTKQVYYIPFSKKNVDEIIANSTKTDKYSIKYTVKFGHEDSPDAMAQGTRNQFSYDMFLWEWDKLYDWQYTPVEDYVLRPRNNKAGKSLEFKPQ